MRAAIRMPAPAMPMARSLSEAKYSARSRTTASDQGVPMIGAKKATLSFPSKW